MCLRDVRLLLLSAHAGPVSGKVGVYFATDVHTLYETQTNDCALLFEERKKKQQVSVSVNVSQQWHREGIQIKQHGFRGHFAHYKSASSRWMVGDESSRANKYNGYGSRPVVWNNHKWTLKEDPVARRYQAGDPYF